MLWKVGLLRCSARGSRPIQAPSPKLQEFSNLDLVAWDASLQVGPGALLQWQLFKW